jgi:OOP family OmpA-OmpF porin
VTARPGSFLRQAGTGLTAKIALAAGLAGLAWAGAVPAQPVALPAGAVQTLALPPEPAAYDLPLGAYDAENRPSRRVEGLVSRWAFRVPLERADEFAVYTAMRDALGADGFVPLFQCSDRNCGGFDFRFGIEVLPPPEMEVDLEAYHFAAFERPAPGAAHLTLLVSRSGPTGYVQIVEITEIGTEMPLEARAPESATGPNSGLPNAGLPPSDWSAELAASGRAVLEGVNFETGQSRLTDTSAPVLAALAAFLTDNPDLSFLIVGHSDNTGTLAANIELSRSRAEAVRQGLIDLHGIEAGRLSAAGAGFLAPRAPNTTEAGQARNRRVELVLR